MFNEDRSTLRNRFSVEGTLNKMERNHFLYKDSGHSGDLRFHLRHSRVNHLTVTLVGQPTGDLKIAALLLQLLPVLHVLSSLLFKLRL